MPHVPDCSICKYTKSKKCESCYPHSSQFKRDPSKETVQVGNTAVIIFKPMVYNDICETPIMISSKKQLKEECKKHDVTAARLL